MLDFFHQTENENRWGLGVLNYSSPYSCLRKISAPKPIYSSNNFNRLPERKSIERDLLTMRSGYGTHCMVTCS